MKAKRLTIDEVKHIANLANLPLSGSELEKFQDQLSQTLDHIENLNEIKTETVEAKNLVTGTSNITRKDTTEPSLSVEDSLANAKQTHNKFFKVKSIFDY